MRTCAAVLVATLALGCGRATSAAPARPGATPTTAPAPARDPRVPGTAVRAGSLRDAAVVDAYAVVVPRGVDPSLVELAMREAAHAAGIEPVIERSPASSIAETLALVDYLGRGLDDAQRAALATATAVVRVGVLGDDATVADTIHHAAAIARAGAEAGEGWIVDLPTRWILTRAAFDEARPAGFPLEVVRLVSVQMVPDAHGGIFLETAGLVRFGLPELYVAGVPRSFSDPVTGVVNAIAQGLIERGSLAQGGVIALDVATLTTPPWPARRAELLADGGTGRLTVTATWSRGHHTGDDVQPMIELGLPGSSPEELYAALSAYQGPEDDPVFRHGDEPRLLAARDRARRELAALAPHFAAGIPVRERLAVKGPFATDSGGVEWMWIDVDTWRGSTLSGTLLNQPDDVSGLRPGARVDVAQGDVYDYLHQRADGSFAGGETDRILQGQ